jgi:hypothetical protein
LGTVKEIDRKFNTGKSRFDNPEEELLLGDKIDIKRTVRTVPSIADYKSI